MALNPNRHSPPLTDGAAQRRLVIAVQAAKAAVGAVLVAAFVLLVGHPERAEALAMAGLLSPAILALLGFSPVSLPILEQLGLGIFAGLIGYLALLTGGVVSPLVVW